MNSVPLLTVFPQRDRHYTPTGHWCWEVYDALTSGPVNGGVEPTREKAELTGKMRLGEVEKNGLYCGECQGFEQIGTEACLGCSMRP